MTCAEHEKATTYVSGNIKAIVPLFRERLSCDESSQSNVNLVRFKRGLIEPICEKRIFGILTADQVGYVPNVKVNFTESADTFCQDTYKFKSMRSDAQLGNFVQVNLEKEYQLEKVVNEYIPRKSDVFDQRLQNICTVDQLEIFYRTLIMDLYRRENKINYNYSANIEKRYFIVPLRLTNQPVSAAHVNAHG